MFSYIKRFLIYKTSSVSNRNEETPAVESAIKRLFPTFRPQTRQHMPLFQTNPRRAKTAKVIMAVMLRKEYLIAGQYLILLRFNPNSVYRPKSAKRVKSSTSKAST